MTTPSISGRTFSGNAPFPCPRDHCRGTVFTSYDEYHQRERACLQCGRSPDAAKPLASLPKSAPHHFNPKPRQSSGAAA